MEEAFDINILFFGIVYYNETIFRKKLKTGINCVILFSSLHNSNWMKGVVE